MGKYFFRRQIARFTRLQHICQKQRAREYAYVDITAISDHSSNPISPVRVQYEDIRRKRVHFSDSPSYLTHIRQNLGFHPILSGGGGGGTITGETARAGERVGTTMRDFH